MQSLLITFSWQEWLHHPWRNVSAVVAVMLGVALAFAVHLINASALVEFTSAVSSVNGQPDREIRARQGLIDDAWLDNLQNHPSVLHASPVLALRTSAQANGQPRTSITLMGVDALSVAAISPALMPRPIGVGQDNPTSETTTSHHRWALFSPDTVYLNAAARAALGLDASTLQVQSGLTWKSMRVAGTVSAPGGPLLVMDIAAAQDLMGQLGFVSRIDLRLKPGTDAGRFVSELQLPPNLIATRPEQSGEQATNLSRAYRVNLTVLALVALFTGAFLVYSVLSLSVTRRQQQFALLGVLGLSAPERLRLVLTESALLGTVGSGLGIALGTGLAYLALKLLGGDLGGGYFSGESPPLQWGPAGALLYGGLGVVAAIAGGWWPARAMARLAPALALKGLGGAPTRQGKTHAIALFMIVLGATLGWAPPIGGIPLAAYLAVGLLLVGGITALPLAVGALLNFLAPYASTRALPLLAVERSRRLKETAAVATSGVVASLALSVALTVMVASFRDSVTQWLDGVLPAQLYVRAGASTGEGNALPPSFVQALTSVNGVARIEPQRSTAYLMSASLPPVALLARPLALSSRGEGAGMVLPLVRGPFDVPSPSSGARVIPVYVSEAMVDLHGVQPGHWMPALAPAFGPGANGVQFFVVGVWRDYARQHGSIAMDRADYVQLSGDHRVNDVAIHLSPSVVETVVQSDIRALARSMGADNLIEFASAGQLRATSLRIFDRSFAVTYWLQAVAIGIGLFGVAASFSAQVLARRREFGLLAHLGLTRADILKVVALEGLAWTTLGALAGLALGLAVSVVLVHVVNPQSFHWTMDLSLPWLHLSALCLAVIAAGTATAWLAGRAAASKDAVQAVKEDW